MPEFIEKLDTTEKIDPSKTKIHGIEDFEGWEEERNTTEGRLKKTRDLALNLGGFSGEHHKAYAIDQIVRALTGCPVAYFKNKSAVGGPIILAGFGESDEYREFIKEHNEGDEGPNTYEWDKGIAP